MKEIYEMEIYERDQQTDYLSLGLPFAISKKVKGDSKSLKAISKIVLCSSNSSRNAKFL